MDLLMFVGAIALFALFWAIGGKWGEYGGGDSVKDRFIPLFFFFLIAVAVVGVFSL
jgi:hypothetical protein